MSRISTTTKYSNGWVVVEARGSSEGATAGVTITYDVGAGAETGEIRDLSYRNAVDLRDMLARATKAMVPGEGEHDEEG